MKTGEFQDALFWTASTDSGLVSLVSPSPGLRYQALQIVQRGTRHANRKCIFIHGDFHSPSPVLLQRHIATGNQTVPDNAETAAPSDLFSPESFPPDCCIFIENAPEFFMLSNYPKYRDLQSDIVKIAGTKHRLCLLTWPSVGMIPDALRKRITEIPGWNRNRIREYYASRRIDVPVSILDSLPEWTSGFPEYIRALRFLVDRTSSVSKFRELLDRELQNDNALISCQCRIKWQEILQNARGHGGLKSVMTILAHHPGSRLTEISRQLESAPQSIRDYLGSLIRIGAVVRSGWEYDLRDPLFRRWIAVRTIGTGLRSNFAGHNQRFQDVERQVKPVDPIEFD